MAVGLLLIGATIVAGGLSSLFATSGFRRDPTAEEAAGRVPILTPSQEAARLVALQEQRFSFERETFRTEISAARAARTEDLIRQEEERRREEVRRARELEREEFRQTRVLIAQQDALAEQREIDRQIREDQAAARREEAFLGAAVRRQDFQRREFEAFARGLPAGFTPVLGSGGGFSSLAPGSSLSPLDVRRGFEPLPFAVPTVTAQRLTQIAGVFVGPGFRFQNVVEAQRFLSESRSQGLRRVG